MTIFLCILALLSLNQRVSMKNVTSLHAVLMVYATVVLTLGLTTLAFLSWWVAR